MRPSTRRLRIASPEVLKRLAALKPANQDYVLWRLGLVRPPGATGAHDSGADGSVCPGSRRAISGTRIASPEVLQRLAVLKPANQDYVLRRLGVVRLPLHLADGTDAPLGTSADAPLPAVPDGNADLVAPVPGSNPVPPPAAAPTSSGTGADPFPTPGEGMLPPFRAAAPRPVPQGATDAERLAAGVEPPPSGFLPLPTGAGDSRPVYPKPFPNPTGIQIAYDPENDIYTYRERGRPDFSISGTDLERKYPKLRQVRPDVRHQVNQALTEMLGQGEESVIQTAIRSPEDQKKAVKQGNSGTLNSYHLDRGQGSRAVDITQPVGWPGTTPEYWRKLGAAYERAGLGWGGRFMHLYDAAHGELPEPQPPQVLAPNRRTP